MSFADDQTLVIVLSDHGMNSFQRGVHLNSWLRDNGLLTLHRNYQSAPHENGNNQFLRHVDWGRTRAYAVGMSGIYLNLTGREEQGIVDQDEARRLKSDIASALSRLGDPVRGRLAIRSVLPREHVYRGPYASESPDLIVNFASGYRVSWSTALGGLAHDQFEDNVRKWSGDHLIDPVLVPGVLFMNRKFRENAALQDMAPTILEALGIPKGGQMEGDSLLV
jgi:predicted AlkP superfamily phosphohydrolase/phosphomutase